MYFSVHPLPRLPKVRFFINRASIWSYGNEYACQIIDAITGGQHLL